MFFTPELLAKRDSGFGLLWLAATLGSKSAFKKLPKRSVLTADISQLCDQISQPAEPLALRLSSNLMFGVVRVYKVKQEIFLTDVTNCVTSLKKVVQDLRSAAAQNGQLEMANPVARPSAVTLVPNPRAAHTLDYDALVVDWDEYLNMGDVTIGSIQVSDEDFDPTQKKKKSGKALQKDAPETEVVRRETHTLDEHHEHVLSTSYDLSFHGSVREAAIDPSSSQVAGPAFDGFFSDALDNGDGFGLELGDDLARELGWAVSPVKSVRGNDRDSDLNFDDFNAHVHDVDFNFDAHDIPAMDIDQITGAPEAQAEGTPSVTSTSKKKKTSRKENAVPLSGPQPTNPQIHALSPVTSFSRQLLSQDIEAFQPLRDITAEGRNKENQTETKKLKRTRLLLDARTELTDEELKIARAKYMQLQRHQRRELLHKRLEKESGRVIEEMIWGGPKEMQAQELINFWQQNFKVQVETRSGIVRLHEDEDYERTPRPKRRRVGPKNRGTIREAPALVGDEQTQIEPNIGANMDACMDWGFDNQDIGMLVEDGGPFRHSSEEPGQARRISSRSGSIIGGNLGFNLVDLDQNRDSQRSSLFPWDNAGLSSSSRNEPAVNFNPAIDPVDVRLRSSSSVSRRESSLAPSQKGSVVGGLTFSPAAGRGGSQIAGEDFIVEDNLLIPEDTQQETQKSEVNLATLEKHSYNFLEYAKMQHQSLPRPDDRLSFELVAPRSTSTRHVAAAAFYHCLVLATKNLVRLEQPEPYVPVLIDII